MRGKFLVLDGNSLIHRAFHALPPLFSSKLNLPTNAAYGFTTMFLKVLEQVKPTHVAVAFDHGRVVFRHEEYREYKAHRAETAEELRPQFDLVRQILAVMHVTTFEQEGYEADDLIGALVTRAAEEGLNSVIVTGDRDALQLVSEQTQVMLTRKGITQLGVYDPAAVKQELGIEPAQVVDYKALTGDKSDNIPGVPGIGPKSASRLIQEYGSLEKVLENAASVKPASVSARLSAYAEQARLSRRLAAIACQLPLQVDWETCRRRSPDYGELVKLFETLEFRSLLKSVLKSMDKEKEKGQTVKQAALQLEEAPEAAPWLRLRSPDELEGYLRRVEEAGQGALQLVWEGEDYLNGPVAAIGLAYPHGEPAGYLPGDGAPWEILANFVRREGISWYGHNCKNILVALAGRGAALRAPAGDTAVMAYLQNPSASGYPLRELALKEIGYTAYTTADGGPAEEAARGAAAIAGLAGPMQEKIRLLDMERLYYQVELPLTRVLADMELTGVRVDREQLEELGQELAAGMESAAGRVYELAGEEFNLNSPRQLGVVLFEKLGLPRGKKTKTGYSTSAGVLEDLAQTYPIAAAILDYRQLMKLKTTYVDGLRRLIDPHSGRVHTTLHQTITATGRLSSAEPNLQNIPIRLEQGRRLRKAFVSSGTGWVLLAGDYSQIELRILAHISGDERMIDGFHRGEDVHTRTAGEVFGVEPQEVTPEMRRRAKAVNFGLVYGLSDYGLARDLGIGRHEAHEYMQRYFARYPGVARYMEEVVARARGDGFVTTILNRRRYLPDLMARDYAVRNAAERTAMNTPIQGSAADVIKLAMVGVHRALEEKGLKAKMILQVHDELIFDVPVEELAEVAALVKREMEQAFPLRVPLVVDLKFGPDWYDMEPWPPPRRVVGRLGDCGA